MIFIEFMYENPVYLFRQSSISWNTFNTNGHSFPRFYPIFHDFLLRISSFHLINGFRSNMIRFPSDFECTVNYWENSLKIKTGKKVSGIDSNHILSWVEINTTEALLHIDRNFARISDLIAHGKTHCNIPIWNRNNIHLFLWLSIILIIF